MDPNVIDLISSFINKDTSIGKSDDQLAANEGSEDTEVKSNDSFVRKTDDVITKSPLLFHVIIFTKDRPWQFSELLRSMQLEEKEDGIDVKISVIANVVDRFAEAYTQAFDPIDKKISVLYESPEQSFFNLLDSVVQNTERMNGPPYNFWMFLTDDCVFLRPLAHVLKQVHHSDDLFLSRLHPGISWCQTRNLPSPPPRNHVRCCHRNIDNQVDTYQYPLRYGKVDWCYPWDLSGGVYCDQLFMDVFQKLNQEDKRHPNVLEVRGNQILSKHISSLTVRFPASPAIRILAINRVQDVYQAPLATKDAESLQPEALLNFWNNGEHLDLDKYRFCHFNSSHIGDLFLMAPEKGKTEKNKMVLSILIPVHSGPPGFASLAMNSVVQQLLHDGIFPSQIVLVDDRCSDGSIDAMVQKAQSITDVHVLDHRGEKQTSKLECSEQDCNITIDIVLSNNAGVASALNTGLLYCRSDLVARMDSDDVCSGGRFVSQMATLNANPQLAVVGTQTVLFMKEFRTLQSNTSPKVVSNESTATTHLPYLEETDDKYLTRAALYPTDAGLTAWAMFFSCCISHPSVMFRRKVVQQLDSDGNGVYNENIKHAEDYHLWSKVLRNHPPNALTSTPHVGLWYRKRPETKTAQPSKKAEIQREETRQIAVEMISEYIDGVSHDQIHPLLASSKKSMEALTAEQIDEAAQLLLCLKKAFLSRHVNVLTKREVALIEYDTKERLSELASYSWSQFGDTSRSVWQLWVSECPDKALEQMALLCQPMKKSRK